MELCGCTEFKINSLVVLPLTDSDLLKPPGLGMESRPRRGSYNDWTVDCVLVVGGWYDNW